MKVGNTPLKIELLMVNLFLAIFRGSNAPASLKPVVPASGHGGYSEIPRVGKPVEHPDERIPVVDLDQ